MKTVLNNHIPQNLEGNTGADPGNIASRDVWFKINKKGYFHSISPLLLEYLEDMDHLFFESNLVGDDLMQGLPSPVEFLKKMINTERESVFVEEVIKGNSASTSHPIWDTIADGRLLRFKLGVGVPKGF